MESYLVTPIVLGFFLIRTTWNNVTLENFKNFVKMNHAGKSRNTNYHLGTGSARGFLWLVLGAAVEFLAPGQYTYTPRMCPPSSLLSVTGLFPAGTTTRLQTSVLGGRNKIFTSASVAGESLVKVK